MEGAGHKGRWCAKALVGIILLLMSTPGLSSEEQECPDTDYLAEKGICCNKCPAGYKLVEKCHVTGHRSNCTPCPSEQFMDEENFAPNCRRCRRCKVGKNEYMASPCTTRQNTICKCKAGYFKSYIDSETYECYKCSQCWSNERVKQNCTPESDTVCECRENYYRVSKHSKCEPCKSCTADCKHHCASTESTIGTDTGNEFFIKTLVGVGAAVCVLVVLVGLVTHFTTKWFTKRSLQELPSHTSEVSPDSSQQVLISYDETWDNNIAKSVPISPANEQEPSNLPDCVPLEIPIPDMIYTVLDQVPVRQVKQLVRSLGVTDTEIEQAEIDHASCREAHYQMLRVWAERGSRAGGGGRGRVLRVPLLQELLSKLQAMDLGRAAEELQTKYGIQ